MDKNRVQKYVADLSNMVIHDSPIFLAKSFFQPSP